MEKILRSRQELIRRYVVFLVSLFIMSFGVSLVTRSLMGTSPISSVPYVWSLNTALSMGTYIIILNAILILAQIIMLGWKGVREYKIELLMQIPVSLLFGLIVAILTGPLVRLIRPHLKFIDRWETVPGRNELTIINSNIRNTFSHGVLRMLLYGGGNVIRQELRPLPEPLCGRRP